MEGISATAYKRLKSYWNKRRRGYKRLNGASEARPRKRWWCRLKLKRIRILRRVGSPKKWLTRLRDAYVKMMLSIANSGLMSTGYGGPVDYGGLGFGKGPLKEYDEKVIVQIHKSLVMAQSQGQAHGGIVARAAPEHAPPHVVSGG